MKLTEKDIRIEVLKELASFNITQVEQFVSMTHSERMLHGLSSVLNLSKEEIKSIAKHLKKKYPSLKIPEPHAPHHPAGYRI